MRLEQTSAAVDLAVVAGFASLILSRPAGAPWLLPLLLVFLVSARRWRQSLPAFFSRACFVPFAAGLLAWPLRLFYWDRADLALRVRNLSLLAALFTLYLLARERRWPRKFLRRFNALALKKRLLAVFLGAELLFILAAALLTQRGVALVGDEPHYLAIGQSLARDGDLNVFNQYYRDGYKEFLDVKKLPAHGTWGKGFKKIYSYHMPGVALTVAPFFFIKLAPPLLYFLLRAYLGLFGAMLAVLVYLFALRLWRSRSLAFFTTLAFSLGAPVFFYSFHIFPEVQAMLLVLGAAYILLYKCGRHGDRCLWAGLLLGSTIFWGVKYAIFIYPVTLGFCAYWLWKKRFRQALMLLVFPLLFQALFFFYLYTAYGSFSPNSVYYGMLNPEQSQALVDTILKRIPLQARWETLLDYFFDQRDGLLLYNPFYFFAFPGLLLALKNFRRYRLHLLAIVPALLFILNHAFSTIRAGYCPQGRYLAPVAWALLLFALIYYRESRNRPFRKAFLALPLYALFVTLYQALRPFTLYQPTTHDSLLRAGAMFQEWSNSRIDLPTLLPSYIKVDNQGYLPNPVFLALFLLLAVLALLPWRPRVRRWSGRVMPALVFLAIFSLASLFPRLDRADARLLAGPRELPVRIHFQPRPAADGGPDSWLGMAGSCRLRIETLVPLKAIEMRLENRSAGEPLPLSVLLFDAPVTGLYLAPATEGRLQLERPRFKRIGARYGYQFELRARPAATGAAPEWQLGFTLR
ncbi:MAG: hypothetical protein MUC72_05190 [Acidobacteria bacterium]|jgi:hypothetical protein|nr:hypothetical protein [Acidobacteriota bacterium]